MVLCLPASAGVLIGAYLLAGGLITSAASQGQSASLTMLLCPHFFEHSFTFVVTPLVAALSFMNLRGVATRPSPA